MTSPRDPERPTSHCPPRAVREADRGESLRRLPSIAPVPGASIPSTLRPGRQFRRSTLAAQGALLEAAARNRRSPGTRALGSVDVVSPPSGFACPAKLPRYGSALRRVRQDEGRLVWRG